MQIYINIPYVVHLVLLIHVFKNDCLNWITYGGGACPWRRLILSLLASINCLVALHVGMGHCEIFPIHVGCQLVLLLCSSCLVTILLRVLGCNSCHIKNIVL